ncbi:MmcQ/YjbR family DNA-binding protein [Streptomyces verrucosisporus]|uniref:MmcQ/YjbR family DNA-binding protein n=1 Tax=Streptomyces verrucosisporus TaxID=1695161 RepID=UPI0019D1AD26|nr:MmcQ/YjbR family DNA-binding protein [Streptomyces verrucosisporus]MBN3929822.1 MmcQ/YjbR family DNA-binding protein [Streptomyces verrucosisporus]
MSDRTRGRSSARGARRDPQAARERVREFALELPGAYEDFPWGESVVKVNRKIFVFLFLGHLVAGQGDSPPTVTVKLTDPEAHAHAMSAPGALLTGYGLGRSGWVTIPLGEPEAPDAELLCDWVEESYRTVAPKRLVAELDARATG